MNLFSLINRRTTSRKNIAIIENDQSITYGHFWETVKALSHAFMGLGIGENTKVAVLLSNSKEFIYCFFALMKVNAIAIPLKVQPTCWELAEIFGDCKPEVVILTARLLDKILAERPSVLETTTLIVKEGQNKPDILREFSWPDNLDLYTVNELYETNNERSIHEEMAFTHPKQPASINYTYRGYGYPLGAMLTHNSYIRGVIRYIKLVEIQPDMRILLLLPVSHVLSLVGCVLVPLMANATIVIASGITPKSIFQAIQKHRVNVIVCVPTLFDLLVRHYDRQKYDISSLRFGISGAEYMSIELHNQIRAQMNIDIVQGYGLTETLPVTCSPRWDNRPVSIGMIAHDVEMKVVDDRGRECRCNEVGEIVVKCPSVMLGYYNAPKETDEVVQGEWLYTGDLGMIDEDKYVHFRGLKKCIAKIDGNTVDLNELRRILAYNDQILVHDIFLSDGVSPPSGRVTQKSNGDAEDASAWGKIPSEETLTEGAMVSSSPNGMTKGSTRLCRKSPPSARERAIFSPGKDGEAGDIGFIVDGAGCSQAGKGPLEARATFPTEPKRLVGGRNQEGKREIVVRYSEKDPYSVSPNEVAKFLSRFLSNYKIPRVIENVRPA